MKRTLPPYEAMVRRLAASAALGPGAAFLLSVAVAWIAIPLSNEELLGVVRLAGSIFVMCLVAYPFCAALGLWNLRALRREIDRREGVSAGPSFSGLVRGAFLGPSRTALCLSVLSIGVVVADALEIVPVSGLEGSVRYAVDLVCVAIFQGGSHFVALRFRTHLWDWLRVLSPADIVIRRPQRLAWRLGSRISSAVLLPPAGALAVMIGRSDAMSTEAIAAVYPPALGFVLLILLGVFFSFRIGRVAERDVGALVGHVDGLLARGPLNSNTVSEWGEIPVSTQAAVELVDSIQVLADRYARLASEEERARRAVEDAHMLRTRFMAYMSHDLRSPLNSITGFAEVLSMEREGRLNAEQRESVRAIRESGEDLVRLVTTIVDAARLEAGRLTIYPAFTSPVEVADEAINRAQRAGRSPGVQLRLDLQPGVPAVFVDAERIVQALTAVLVHLLRDGDGTPGPIRVRVHFDPVGRSGRPAVLFDVEGRARLDLAHYARILDGHRQVQGPGGRRVGGMGLGLSLCHSLVVTQGGAMHCEEAPGGETRFRIALPVDLSSVGGAS